MMEHSLSLSLDDLPYWMQQARRGRDWGALLVLAFSLLAAWPFLSQPGLPQAAENYVYMTADYSQSLHEGRLYPRWSPNVLGGYGAPIPNFFPPAAPYSAALVKTLFTNNAALAVRIIFASAFLLAGVSSYAFVRRRSSAAAGLLVALLYLYSPYFGHTLPYVRGDLAHVLALALVPLLLWAVDRLLADNRPLDMLLTTLAAALLVLADPAIAVAALILGLLLLCMDVSNSPVVALRVIVSLGLGIGLAAFYWLPALLESSRVYWIQTTPPPALQWGTLFKPLQVADPGALIPLPQLSLGIALPVVTMIGLLALIVEGKQRVFHLVFLLTGLLALIVGVGFVPEEHWLLGIACLCLSIGGSAALNLSEHLPQRAVPVFQVMLAVVVLASGLTTLVTPPFSVLAVNVQPLNQLLYEQQRFGIAVLPPDAALPSPFPSLPAANRLLLSGYESDNINKIAPVSSASRARINLLSHKSERERFQVTSQIPLSLTLLTAYYPGWKATAAGNPVKLTADPQTGLIVLDVPPMNGELNIEFGSTPLRLGAWGLSFGALLAILILSWRRFRRDSRYLPDKSLLQPVERRWASAVLFAFAAAALLFALPNAPFAFPREPGMSLDSAQNLRHRSESGLETLAYRLSAEQLHPGDQLNVTLYWRTIRPLSANYQTRLALYKDDTGERFAVTAYRSPGNYPTSRWRSFMHVANSYDLRLPDDLPPGEYHISVEVFDCSPECSEGLTFFSADGRNIGQLSFLDTPIQVQS